MPTAGKVKKKLDIPVGVHTIIEHKGNFMWNPKNLKKYGKVQKVSLDRIDLEAMAEGAARNAFSKMLGKSPVGKRTAKENRNRDRGAQIVGNQRVKNLTKDHTEACNNVGYEIQNETEKTSK